MKDRQNRLVVTCGPGYEAIDAVRRITNFSTGTLGAELSARFRDAGHRVILLRGELSTAPAPEGIESVPFSTGEDLLMKLAALAGEGGVSGLFHAAALADYRVIAVGSGANTHPVGVGKIPSAGGNLTIELAPAPKVLPQLRGLFPRALIAGWKYEVEGNGEDVLSKGAAQVRDAGTDLCVVNGPAYGSGFGIVQPGREVVRLATPAALASALLALLKERLGGI